MIHTLWFNYEVPSLYGNGPEAITELIIVGIISALLIPPIRRWIKSEFHKVHEKIDLGHKEIHERLDRSHERQDELLRHVQHVIKHTKAIPDLPPKEDQ